MGRIVFCCLLWCSSLGAAEAPLQPVTVCEVLKDLNAYNGKAVMVVGRFSFRKTGRSLSEETCDPKASKSEPPESNELWLAYDPKTAPKLSPVFEIDAAVLRQKVKVVRQHTALRQFRFGSADYDRWAMVYGRVEARQGFLRVSPTEVAPKTSPLPSQAGAQLSYTGDGVIVFLDDIE